MKICKECNELLPLSNFSRNKNLKDGYENKCKKCRNKARLKYECICISCGNVWRAQTKNAKYCSTKCKPQHTKNRVNVECSYCGKQKQTIKSNANKFDRFYCSMDCKNKHLGILNKGENSNRYNKIEVPCYSCGKVFNKTKSQFDKYEFHFCSKECQSNGFKILLLGENNPNYNPNKSQLDRENHRNIPFYNDWVLKVFERDSYACKCCGDSTGGNLNAHHILNYSEHKHLRVDISNGITLCDKCHKKFHITYGYKNNNKFQIEEFLNEHGNTVPSLGGNFLEGVETR
ncbi:MAG: HNH endonuclease [Sarcina sp.]